jgi:hypothetical protein
VRFNNSIWRAGLQQACLLDHVRTATIWASAGTACSFTEGRQHTTYRNTCFKHTVACALRKHLLLQTKSLLCSCSLPFYLANTNRHLGNWDVCGCSPLSGTWLKMSHPWTFFVPNETCALILCFIAQLFLGFDQPKTHDKTNTHRHLVNWDVCGCSPFSLSTLQVWYSWTFCRSQQDLLFYMLNCTQSDSTLPNQPVHQPTYWCWTVFGPLCIFWPQTFCFELVLPSPL